MASIRNWQELSLHGSQSNSCEPWTRDVMRMCQLTVIYSNIKVPRHDPWEFVKLSRDQDVLIECFK